MRLRLKLRPGPAGGAHDAPQTPSWLGMGYPSLYLTPLSAWILPPSALATRRFDIFFGGGALPPPNIFP